MTYKPTVKIFRESNTVKCINEMMKHEKLFYECTDTEDFAYYFSQLSNRAICFDYLLSIGVIPEDYLTDRATNETP